MEDLPLPALFEHARKIHTTAMESGADQVHAWFLVSFLLLWSEHFFFFCWQSVYFMGDLVTQELVRKGCEALQKCEDMINKLGLFSTNETKEDISTTNLKYILVIICSEVSLTWNIIAERLNAKLMKWLVTEF